MKTRPFLGAAASLGLAAIVPAMASAQSSAGVDPLALGSADAVLNYCRQVNPVGAPAYWQLKASMFGKQSAATLAALKATAQYKSGFSHTHGILMTTPGDWTLQACLNLVSSAVPRTGEQL